MDFITIVLLSSSQGHLLLSARMPGYPWIRISSSCSHRSRQRAVLPAKPILLCDVGLSSRPAGRCRLQTGFPQQKQRSAAERAFLNNGRTQWTAVSSSAERRWALRRVLIHERTMTLGSNGFRRRRFRNSPSILLPQSSPRATPRFTKSCPTPTGQELSRRGVVPELLPQLLPRSCCTRAVPHEL